MAAQTEIAKYRKENLLLKKQIEDQTGKTVEQLYAERVKRVKDVIELRTPDRVPFMVLVEAHRYSGIPNSAAYYDPITLKRTMRKMAVDLEPDMSEPGFPSCGAAMTELDVQNCVWPGGPKPEDYEYLQAVVDYSTGILRQRSYRQKRKRRQPDHCCQDAGQGAN